jgi:hypothetical protein
MQLHIWRDRVLISLAAAVLLVSGLAITAGPVVALQVVVADVSWTAAGTAGGDAGFWAEMQAPGHVFYDKLQGVLIEVDFDAFAETQCAKEYAPRRGRPSLPAGRYFRMLLIGYFEGIDSERGLEWRCAGNLALREFLRLSEREGVGSLVVEPHQKPPSARSPRPGLHLGPRMSGRAWPDQVRAHRRRCLDDGSQRGVAHDRSARQRRRLSRDADTYGRESGIETPTADDRSAWIAIAKVRSYPTLTGRVRPTRMPGSPS